MIGLDFTCSSINLRAVSSSSDTDLRFGAKSLCESSENLRRMVLLFLWKKSDDSCSFLGAEVKTDENGRAIVNEASFLATFRRRREH